MLSKSQISLITSLQHKKFRRQHNLFIVEGLKSVTDFCHSGYIPKAVYHIPAFGAKMLNLSKNINSVEISISEMERISTLQTPQGVLALMPVPAVEILDTGTLKGKFTLALDGVQDPGNLGTIIRTADWFGIDNILCSEDTADVYNPKVVQATMGSLARVNVHYCDLQKVIKSTKLPVFGALLNGDSIYNTRFGTEGIILMGNEGNGISNDLLTLISNPVTIPAKGRAESLNVAVATAVFCSEVYRNSLK